MNLTDRFFLEVDLVDRRLAVVCHDDSCYSRKRDRSSCEKCQQEMRCLSSYANITVVLQSQDSARIECTDSQKPTDVAFDLLWIQKHNVLAEEGEHHA